MSVTVIKATLKSGNFRQHKSNPKGNTLIFSRNHPTEKFVRIIVDSGIDKNTGKIVSQPSVSSVYININKHWREIVSAHKGANLSGLITTVESRASSAAKCKHCSAKKFKAKSGKVVCANACWTNWSGNKKKTTQKTSQKNPQKIQAQKTTQKSSQKIAPKNPSRKTPQKSSVERWSLNLQPGDLVTVEEVMKDNEVVTDYTGSILGVVVSVNNDSYGNSIVKTQWTANTSALHEWQLPTNALMSRYAYSGTHTRFKVLSRKVNWVKA
jgi:uncharacterized Zn finger protein (UPF0148 family)